MGCTTMVRVQVHEDFENNNPPEYKSQVSVFESADNINRPYKVVGTVYVTDTGLSVDCGFGQMVDRIKGKAVAIGADAAFLDSVRPPSIWSTCYQGTALLIVYEDKAGPQAVQPREGNASTGTGFLISTKGYIATNQHVIEGKSKITILGGGLEKEVSAEVLVSDSTNDIAILKITDSSWIAGGVLPYKFRESGAVKLGEDVFTMGYPLGQILGKNVKLTRGTISSLSGIQDDPRIYQTTTEIQPGNSGGPLVDSSGNIVGIVVATLNPSFMIKYTGSLPQNINFAIKIDYLISLARMKGIKMPGGVGAPIIKKEIFESAEKIAPRIYGIRAE